MAHYHGRVVGSNMVASPGDMIPVKSVPFFWTQQYGKSLRYTGKSLSVKFVEQKYADVTQCQEVACEPMILDYSIKIYSG